MISNQILSSECNFTIEKSCVKQNEYSCSNSNVEEISESNHPKEHQSSEAFDCCSVISNHIQTCKCETPQLHSYILHNHRCRQSCQKPQDTTAEKDLNQMVRKPDLKLSIDKNEHVSRQSHEIGINDNMDDNSIIISNIKTELDTSESLETFDEDNNANEAIGRNRINSIKNKKLMTEKTFLKDSYSIVENTDRRNQTRLQKQKRQNKVALSISKKVNLINENNNELDHRSKNNEDDASSERSNQLFKINKTATFHSFSQNSLIISSVLSLKNTSEFITRSVENDLDIKQEKIKIENDIEMSDSFLENSSVSYENNDIISPKKEPQENSEDMSVPEEGKDDTKVQNEETTDSSNIYSQSPKESTNPPFKSNLNGFQCKFPLNTFVEKTCKLCMVSFTDFSLLVKHLDTHRSKGFILCYYCQKSFTDKSSLNKHVRTHTGEKPYRCELCGKCFSLVGNYKKHVDIHENVRKQECVICGKTFRRKEHLKQHIRTHTGEKPFQCTLCPSAFTARYSLQIHLNVHLGQKPYKCNHCDKSFTDKSTLRKHIRVHTGEKPYYCSFCGKSFGESGTLAAHVSTHGLDRPFKCTLCVLSFKNKGGLRQHLKVHAGIKNFSCKVCNMKFIQRHNMLLHEQTHSEQKSFQCTHCSRVLKNKNGFLKHIKLHGDQESKKHACNICEKKFHRKSHLRKHINAHLGVKNFACDVCSKQFTSENSLRKHKIIFHTKGSRIHPCDVCGKIFKRRVYVQKHKCQPKIEES